MVSFKETWWILPEEWKDFLHLSFGSCSCMKDTQAPHWWDGDWFEGNVSLSSSPPQTHTHTHTHMHSCSNHSAETCAGGSGEEAEEGVKSLKWARMTAGALIWCRGLTAACPLDWLIGLIWQRGKKMSLKGPKYLLFSSSLSPHLNSLPHLQLSLNRLVHLLTFSESPFNNRPSSSNQGIVEPSEVTWLSKLSLSISQMYKATLLTAKDFEI